VENGFYNDSLLEQALPRGAGAFSSRLTMAYDGQLLTVIIGQTSDPLIFISQHDNGPVVEYTYKIKE